MIHVQATDLLPTTSIIFDLPSRSIVTLTVYDNGGAPAARLLSRIPLGPGSYEAAFDASGLASGVYLFTLVAAPLLDNGLPSGGPVFHASRKMMLLK